MLNEVFQSKMKTVKLMNNVWIKFSKNSNKIYNKSTLQHNLHQITKLCKKKQYENK